MGLVTMNAGETVRWGRGQEEARAWKGYVVRHDARPSPEEWQSKNRCTRVMHYSEVHRQTHIEAGK